VGEQLGTAQRDAAEVQRKSSGSVLFQRNESTLLSIG